MDDVTELLLDQFNNKECEFYGKVMFKYNGMSIKLKVKQIPEVIKKLVEMDVLIYSVYEQYEIL